MQASLFQDKQGIPWWLGISYKGIGQYDLQDKVKPRKVSFLYHCICWVGGEVLHASVYLFKLLLIKQMSKRQMAGGRRILLAPRQ